MEVALRSPLSFQLPRLMTTEAMKAPRDTVSIEFEGREFVWHPPMSQHDEALGRLEWGPMVSVVYEADDERPYVARSLQRFLSVAAFVHEEPVEDVNYGGMTGSGETDPFNPHGTRTQKAYLTTHKREAPIGFAVDAADDALWLALGSYREGMNAGSPFYRCLAYRNALDAVFGVRRETVRHAVTPEAAARDAFIEAAAGQVVALIGRDTPPKGWAHYLRDDIRNALSHIIREEGQVQVNPDDPIDRERLRDDAPALAGFVQAAVSDKWPNAVRVIPRPDARYPPPPDH